MNRTEEKEERRGVPKVSVIVPALNEEGYIDDLLRDLAAQTRPAAEVIVVDAGSSDGTVEAVENSPVGARLVHGSRPVANGRNLGAGQAQGDLLVFLDADVRLERDFLQRFVEEIERRGLDLACPHYTSGDSSRAARELFWAISALLRLFERVLPSGAGACIAVRREVFETSRGFDPEMKFEDVEFVRRLARGRRFGITDQAVRVSDRRFLQEGEARTALRYSLLTLLFALGRFRWANLMDYEFGRYGEGRAGR